MQQEELKTLFEKNDAILSGHFKLSSGLHSDTYFQPALILQYPKKAAFLAQELSNKLKEKKIIVDVVISPALGGVIIGYEMGRFLGVRSIFTERMDAKVLLKRGFFIREKERVLISEDVITTGLSTKEVINFVKPFGCEIVAVSALVDRSVGKVNFEVPIFSLLKLEVINYKEQECPMCKSGIPIVKPGSRK